MTTDTNRRPHVPAGATTGGQFTVGAKPEAQVFLDGRDGAVHSDADEPAAQAADGYRPFCDDVLGDDEDDEPAAAWTDEEGVECELIDQGEGTYLAYRDDVEVATVYFNGDLQDHEEIEGAIESARASVRGLPSYPTA